MSASQKKRYVEKAGTAMGRELDCLRCGTRMRFLSRQNVKERSLFLDELARAINVDWYVCPKCDYLELYRARKKR